MKKNIRQRVCACVPVLLAAGLLLTACGTAGDGRGTETVTGTAAPEEATRSREEEIYYAFNTLDTQYRLGHNFYCTDYFIEAQPLARQLKEAEKQLAALEEGSEAYAALEAQMSGWQEQIDEIHAAWQVEHDKIFEEFQGYVQDLCEEYGLNFEDYEGHLASVNPCDEPGVDYT